MFCLHALAACRRDAGLDAKRRLLPQTTIRTAMRPEPPLSNTVSKGQTQQMFLKNHRTIFVSTATSKELAFGVVK